MNIYETPETNLDDFDGVEIRPIKGLTVGFFFWIFLMIPAMAVSMGIQYLLTGDFDLESEPVVTPLTMSVDVVMFACIYFYIGRHTARYFKYAEVSYSGVLCFILVILSLLITPREMFDYYPIWYNVLCYMEMLLIVAGARSKQMK